MPTMIPTKETVNKGKQSWWRKGPNFVDFVHETVLPNITYKTIKFVNENSKGDQPFFVHMPLSAPHTPILPTDELKRNSGLDNTYDDFVLMVDWVEGEVIKNA
jgi:arylsulfatase A